MCTRGSIITARISCVNGNLREHGLDIAATSQQLGEHRPSGPGALFLQQNQCSRPLACRYFRVSDGRVMVAGWHTPPRYGSLIFVTANRRAASTTGLTA